MIQRSKIHPCTQSQQYKEDMTQHEKTQNIFLYENFHILQSIKVFDLEILEKISWNMQLQAFISYFFSELRVEMK